MDPLIAFLRARLDERETEARSVRRVKPNPPVTSFGFDGVTEIVIDPKGQRTDPDAFFDEHAEPAPDTARLADIDSKRRIIDRAEFVTGHGPAVDHTRAMDMTTGAASALRDVLKLLALPFAEHPDYRAAWRP